MTSNVKKIAYTGLMTALVLLATSFIKVPVPFTSGYIHLGDSMIFLSGVILGPLYGAFAAGVGSALADLLSPYANWALPTFIIKSLMGFIVGYAVLNKDKKKAIFTLGGIFTIIWAAFNLILKSILDKQITTNSLDLVEPAGLTSIEELTALSDKVSDQLLLFTLIIPIIILVASIIINRNTKIKTSLVYTIGFIVSGTIMVFGYYIATYIMYGSYILPIFEIPWNMIQFILGFVIAELILIGLIKSKVKF